MRFSFGLVVLLAIGSCSRPDTIQGLGADGWYARAVKARKSYDDAYNANKDKRNYQGIINPQVVEFRVSIEYLSKINNGQMKLLKLFEDDQRDLAEYGTLLIWQWLDFTKIKETNRLVALVRKALALADKKNDTLKHTDRFWILAKLEQRRGQALRFQALAPVVAKYREESKGTPYYDRYDKVLKNITGMK